MQACTGRAKTVAKPLTLTQRQAGNKRFGGSRGDEERYFSSSYLFGFCSSGTSSAQYLVVSFNSLSLLWLR